jgi:cytochrome c-type biogenesis protein
MAQITVIAAFLAGLVSFLSPCVLPLLPSFLAYISQTAPKDFEKARKKIFLNSVFYVLGFTLVFSALGVLLNSFLSTSSYMIQSWLSRLGGVFIIVLGLHMMELLKIPLFDREFHLKKRKFESTYLTSFVFGASFAVGWTPCVGAVLGAVLTLAVSNPGQSFLLLTFYSLGLGVPFLLAGAFSAEALKMTKKITPNLRYFNQVIGLFLVFIGVLVFTQNLGLIANFDFVNRLLQ